MSRMFGERIHQLVLSSDIIDQELFEEILELIESYLIEELDASYFAVLDKGKVDGQPGLKTVWSSMEDVPTYTIGKMNEETNLMEYSTYSGYAFTNNVPLWIVSAPEHFLQPNQENIDLWSDTKDASFSQVSLFIQQNNKLQTAIIHPLTVDGQPIGVIEIASEKYVNPTPAAFDEIRLLASVISKAYRMFDLRRVSRSNTKKAMKMLKESRNEESWARLALPQIFVAYSGGTELDDSTKDDHAMVINIIRKVADGFKGKLKVIYWEDIVDSGNINSQVIGEITSSDFGITYFSEPVEQQGEPGRVKYLDNPNVLFEAGMMQALTNTPGSQLKGWIPIREKRSSDIPFDIAAERILLVGRDDNDGTLDTENFEENLRKRVKHLIGEEEPEFDGKTVD